MKYLKSNTSLIFLLLTIGITATSHINIFKPPKVLIAENCYTDVSYFATQCLPLIRLIINQSNCPFSTVLGKRALGSSPIDPAKCGEDGNVFCCAILRESPPAIC